VAKQIRKNYANPSNDCVKFTTQPEQLRVGEDCERELSGNDPFPDGYNSNGSDGYMFVSEGSSPTTPEVDPNANCQTLDKRGYHKIQVSDVFRGIGPNGNCPSPYSRAALGGKTFNDITRDREEQLLLATGRPVTLLRKQHTGRRCPCYDTNRGRSRLKCEVCFGTTFVPGYIPYIYQKDPLGRIRVRFEPFTEDLPLKEQGMFQEVKITCWTLSFPELRKRDVLIVYNEDGSEEFRYEIENVTKNSLFGLSPGAQKFTVVRIDPTQTIYKFDQYKIPDLLDITIDLSDLTIQQENMEYQQLGTQDDGPFTNVVVEAVYGDGAFSGMFAEGYKIAYETNFRRILAFKEPLWTPDFNADGQIDDGYGPVFKSSTGKIIRFSTPQTIQDNAGINPLEVIAAEKKRYFIDGWLAGSKHGVLDAENELRARGLLA